MTSNTPKSKNVAKMDMAPTGEVVSVLLERINAPASDEAMKIITNYRAFPIKFEYKGTNYTFRNMSPEELEDLNKIIIEHKLTDYHFMAALSLDPLFQTSNFWKSLPQADSRKIYNKWIEAYTGFEDDMLNKIKNFRSD